MAPFSRTSSELLLNEFKQVNWLQIQKEMDQSGILYIYRDWGLGNWCV